MERLLADFCVPLEDIENSEACAVQFEYPNDEPTPGEMLGATLMLFQWIRKGSNPVARDVRMQACYYFLMGGRLTQEDLAKEIGVKKATVNQQACDLRDFLSSTLNLQDTFDRIAAATGMRTNQARKTFSDSCKSTHQKRKALSVSTGSQTTSTANSTKQSSLRAKVLAAEGRQ